MVDIAQWTHLSIGMDDIYFLSLASAALGTALLFAEAFNILFHLDSNKVLNIFVHLKICRFIILLLLVDSF